MILCSQMGGVLFPMAAPTHKTTAAPRNNPRAVFLMLMVFIRFFRVIWRQRMCRAHGVFMVLVYSESVAVVALAQRSYSACWSPTRWDAVSDSVAKQFPQEKFLHRSSASQMPENNRGPRR